MALLIVNLDKFIGNAEAWCDRLAEQFPNLEIRIWPDVGEPSNIEYLAFMHPDFDILPTFPNLKAMFSREAGVESFVNHPKLPNTPLGKLEPSGGDPMMTEYVIMHALRFHRDMPAYQAHQAKREWHRGPITRPEERRIGFLGYGRMAKAPGVGFEVAGIQRLGLGPNAKSGCRSSNFSRPRSTRAFSQPNRHRRLSVAAHEGNGGHILRSHLRHDAERSNAD